MKMPSKKLIKAQTDPIRDLLYHIVEDFENYIEKHLVDMKDNIDSGEEVASLPVAIAVELASMIDELEEKRIHEEQVNNCKHKMHIPKKAKVSSNGYVSEVCKKCGGIGLRRLLANVKKTL